MRSLTKRESLIFTLCLILTGSYGGYFLVYKPLLENLSGMDTRIAISEKKLINNLKIVNKGKSIEGVYEKLVTPFRQKTSDEQAMTSILSEIESVANQTSLRISDMQPKKVKRIDFYNHFSVTLTVEGDMQPVIKFLYTLQNSPHLFKVDEIYLEKSSIKAREVRCRLIVSKPLIPA